MGKPSGPDFMYARTDAEEEEATAAAIAESAALNAEALAAEQREEDAAIAAVAAMEAREAAWCAIQRDAARNRAATDYADA